VSAPSAAAADGAISLSIAGMTCGACAARVERALNSVDGVDARVNYATERATVLAGPAVTVDSLLDAVAAAGYKASADADGRAPYARDEQLDREVRSLCLRLIVSATLFMPLCDLSIFFSIDPSLRFAGWQWLMIALALPVVTWAAWPFYTAAVRAARHHTTTMDTLVSLGIAAATGWSLYTMFHLAPGGGSVTLSSLAHGSASGIYFDVPAGVTTFLLAGRYFEAWSKRRSGNALRALASLEAPTVGVLAADGAEETRPLAALRPGERFVVRPGERVAADGEVVDGHAALDRSVMTGESAPVDVGPGDAVLGGTVSLNGRLVVRASRVGADSQLGHMIQLVEHAQNERAAVQRLADRICAVFVPVVMVISLGTLAFWLLTGSSADTAINASLSVLIIACPCALGLATPAALVAATWAGTRLGIFFKGYGALEASRAVDTVVFDKTGTLTTGQMTLCASAAVPGGDAREMLSLAGAVESASEHPVARAISAAARDGGPLPEVAGFLARPGVGASGTVDGVDVDVASVAQYEAADELPAALAARCREWQALGSTVVAVRIDEQLAGLFAVSDRVRPTAAAAVQRLHALGLRCVLLTGDGELTARAVAAAVGIDEVHAGTLPAAKVQFIRRLQGEGRRVAMVGDGVNDAPALAAADLGLAVGSGTDIAMSAADLIIVSDDLSVTASAIALARRTLSTIRGNLAWAFAYNVVAIPLAAAGLLDPLIAGAAMALSSSFVVWNSARLRRAAPGGGDLRAASDAAGGDAPAPVPGAADAVPVAVRAG